MHGTAGLNSCLHKELLYFISLSSMLKFKFSVYPESHTFSKSLLLFCDSSHKCLPAQKYFLSNLLFTESWWFITHIFEIYSLTGRKIIEKIQILPVSTKMIVFSYYYEKGKVEGMKFCEDGSNVFQGASLPILINILIVWLFQCDIKQIAVLCLSARLFHNLPSSLIFPSGVQAKLKTHFLKLLSENYLRRCK